MAQLGFGLNTVLVGTTTTRNFPTAVVVVLVVLVISKLQVPSYW